MVLSMTGYGSASVELSNATFLIELKALNSKNLDLRTRMPSVLMSKEIELRNIIGKSAVRGKVDLNISLDQNTGSKSVRINAEAFERHYEQIASILASKNTQHDFVNAILQLPDVTQTQETVFTEDDSKSLSNAAKVAAKNLLTFRANEGEKLKVDVEQNINEIGTLLTQIPQYEVPRIEKLREKYESQLIKLSQEIEYDKSRLEQEMIYFIEKLDLNEEKIRLKSHIDYFLEVINNGSSQKGKKLGFIAQEIGREINTIGSKANDLSIQKIVVLMKDSLEKIKEQLLNIL